MEVLYHIFGHMLRRCSLKIGLKHRPEIYGFFFGRYLQASNKSDPGIPIEIVQKSHQISKGVLSHPLELEALELLQHLTVGSEKIAMEKLGQHMDHIKSR